MKHGQHLRENIAPECLGEHYSDVKVGHLGNLIIGVLFLCTTILCLSVTAIQLLFYKRYVMINITFLFFRHISTILYYWDQKF